MGSLDFLKIKLIDYDITRVGIPYDSSWRILPYTVLTSIQKTPSIPTGSSLCEFANGERRTFSPGTSILIPRNVKHRFTNLVHPHTSVWIHWDVTIGPSLDLFSFCTVPPVIRGNNSQKIMEYCRDIVHLDQDELRGIVCVKSLLYSLLDIVLNECHLRDEYYNFKSSYRTFLPLIKYIDANLHHKLLLSDIADFLNCSVSKMQRDFLNTFGHSIGDFIIKRRLNLVSRLICSSNSTLTEIADLTGFSDAFSLSKSFKKCYGLSPREYRKIALKI